jgi:POT family proton-dependent oligopeptide transporter
MGAAFLTLFASNMIIGRVGALYEHMTPGAFWTMNASIAATGALLAFLLARPLTRILDHHD